LESGNTFGDIEAMWKQLARQSERQLGAYIAIYMRECGAVPPSMGSKSVELRNDVIHRGKIPDRSEAVAYGEAVLGVVRPALAVAKTKLSKGVEQITTQHVIAAHLSLQTGARVATSCMSTILSLTNSEISWSERGIEEALTGLKLWNWPP
jgi:hypothetical protein